MTRDTRDWLKAHRWEIGLALFLVGGWVARVEAAVSTMRELVPDHEVVLGLGRLACLKDRLTAQAAGIPCGKLLGDR